MPIDYLHNHSDFESLLRIVAEEKGIDPYLIEKDYWLMHVLFGLKRQGYHFNLKGGTSLSKGYQIIDRFSEDIDIYIKPDKELKVNETGQKRNAVNSRKEYYNHLAKTIKVDGIVKVERDVEFDDTSKYRSGGIRLVYNSLIDSVDGVKEGILLEAGFDTVTPCSALSISSWAFDKASNTEGIQIVDNRAIDVTCYHPGYTFVEKLQTIITKYRQEDEQGVEKQNLMRQYYDVANLLNLGEVQSFIGTDAYEAHKKTRFSEKDLVVPVSQNAALRLSSEKMKEFEKRYDATAALYYSGQPPFKTLMDKIHQDIERF